MLPNLSNAAFLVILWVKCSFAKGDICNMLGESHIQRIKVAAGKLLQHPCLLD
jgi:hypothetical protein